jgi:hypothetical protein
MALFASFSIVSCPKCGVTILARGIYHSQTGPKLDTTKCEHCKTELQVSKDPATGEIRAERVNKS